MRRSLSLLAGLVVAAPVVLAASPASADVTFTYLEASVDNSRRDHPLTIRVQARSATGVTKITARLRAKDATAHHTVVEDFRLAGGTVKDGVWTAVVPFDIAAHPGTHAATVTVESSTVQRTLTDGFQACYATTVEGLTTTPAVIDISRSDITMRGRVVSRQFAEDVPKPLGGASLATETERGAADEQGAFSIGVRGTAGPTLRVDARMPYCAAYLYPEVQVVKTATVVTGRMEVPPGPVPVGTSVPVSGRVVWSGPEGPVGVADENIAAYALDGTGTGRIVGSGQTKADGTFSFTGKAPLTGRVEVRFRGTPFLNASAAPIGELVVVHPTRIADLKIGLAAPGQVKATGTLMRDGLDGSERVRNAAVLLEWSPDGKTWTKQNTGTTLPSGDFTISANVPGNGSWRVRYAGDRSHRPAVGGSTSVPAYAPTVLTSPAITPNPVTEGAALTVKSRLTRKDAGRTGPLGGAPVVLEFSPDGTRWSSVANGRTDAQGNASLRVKAVKDGRWRVRYLGDLSNWGTTSAAVHVNVRHRTGFELFQAGPEPVRKGRALNIQGRLIRYAVSWKPAAAGTKVTISFRAKGASKWSRVAVLKADRHGWFHKSFKAAKDGTWMASYNGGADHAPSNSPGDYVDVR